MANTQKYLNHLLQRTGITPACSEEERLAAEELAGIFRNHGFDPEVQEFTAAPSNKLAIAVMGILVFLGALFMGFGGFLGGLGFVLALAGAVLYGMERTGHPFLSKLGTSGVSQNVIAYHKAEGPLASPRNRPVVVVAHYDSPRGDIMAQMPYASYRVTLGRVLPVAMFVPVAVAVLRFLPLPGFLKVILWLAAIAVALVPLAFAVAAIVNSFVLPYTSGSVCNKSSVAAMLGVMDAVAPYQGSNEFPNDVPFEQYFGEQKRRAADAARAAAAYAGQKGDAPVVQYGDVRPEEPVEPQQPQTEVALAAVSDVQPEVAAQNGQDVESTATAVDPFEVIAPVEDEDTESDAADEPIEVAATGHEDVLVSEERDASPAQSELSPSATVTMDASDIANAAAAVETVEEIAESDTQDDPVEMETKPAVVNIAGNYRYGKDVIASLGMLPGSCEIEYDEGQMPEPPMNDGEPSANVSASAPTPEAAPVSVQATAQMAPLTRRETEDAVDTEGYAANDGYYETAEPMAYARSSYGETERGFERVTEGLSSFGDKAAGFFNRLIKRGKDMVDSFESARAAEEESWEDEPVEREAPSSSESVHEETSEPAQMPPVDATMTFEPMPSSTAMFESPVEGEPSADAVESSEAPVSIADPEVAPTTEDESEPAQSVSATVSFDRTAVAPALEDDSADATVVTEQAAPTPQQKYSTQIFTMPTTEPVVEEVEKQPDTVDSLMAEISSHIAEQTAKKPAPAPQMVSPAATVARPSTQQTPTKLNAVPDPSLPSMQQANAASRASLFDLPDPASADADPLGERQVPAQSAPVPPAAPASGQAQASGVASELPVIHAADESTTVSAEKPKKKGLGGLFGRKKKKGQQSMSDWLGVEDGFDAKNSGRDIGSWDNFDDDDWKGGAASSDGASAEEMVSAVASLGDDELLGHDIWFVATGASERGNAGMKAFLETHRDKLRGVFFINLESIGAGRVSMVATEGGDHVMKGDRRIMNLVSRVSSAFHTDYAAVDMPFAQTDAHAVMESSLRALTIAGIDGPRFACSRTDEDAPHNIDPSNVAMTAEVVTEVIRRS